MPREKVHWLVADSVFRALPDGWLKQRLAEHYSLYLIGAVIYDSPYCSPAGFLNRQFYNGARAAHGMNLENTWRPFERLSLQCPDDGPSIALAAGALTHLMTDASFHPAVYWFTGRNTLDHFILETVLNELLEDRVGVCGSRNFGDLINLADREWRVVEEWMVRFFGASSKGQGMAKALLRRHARVYHLLEPLDPWIADKGGLLRGTWEQSFQYRHPVTGAYMEDSLQSLWLRSVNRSLRILGGWALSWQEGWPGRFFGSLEPVSPLTGLNPGEGYQPRYCYVSGL